MYGKKDLRLENFDLPEIKDDEILAHIISDSICMSSYKAAEQGSDHKRVPNDIAKNPVMIGHEFWRPDYQSWFQMGRKVQGRR